MEDKPKGPRWTLQQFCIIARRAWYALQKQTYAGIERQFTGYRHELESIAHQMDITPEELPPTTEKNSSVARSKPCRRSKKNRHYRKGGCSTAVMKT